VALTVQLYYYYVVDLILKYVVGVLDLINFSFDDGTFKRSLKHYRLWPCLVELWFWGCGF